MARFTLPRDLYHGKGVMKDVLSHLEGKRAIIVTGGSSMRRGGFLDKAEKALKKAKMQVLVYEGVEPDPSVTTVMKGAKVMQEFQPDWIIAIGGGSPIDAAKAMWAFYEYPDVTFESLCIPFNFPELRKKAHFVAIPSTSGTATEVTAFSVITDYEKGIKYPLADFNITPDIAVIDYELVESLPVKQVAYTGLDALTHAIEAYVSTCANNFTDSLALYAIKLIFENLKDSYDGNMKARGIMHDAQCLAGMAFSNALLGIVHSMAHKSGAVFKQDGKTVHIVHGCANAMYLTKVIAYNAKNLRAKRRYAEIASYLGLKGSSQAKKVEVLIEKIAQLRASVNTPSCIKDYDDGNGGRVSEQEFLSKLEAMADNAIADACTISNPRKPTHDEMVALYKACYYDTEVDF